VLTACANEPAAVKGRAPHHRDGTFQNNYVEFAPRGLMALLRWKWQAWRDGLPAPPQTPTPTIVPDLGLIQSNAKAGAAMVPTVTWIGHATLLIQLAGVNILTDPQWSERASPLSFAGPPRVTPPGLRFEDLPPIHIVLISHDHYDHLDEATVRRLAETHHPRFYVPL